MISILLIILKIIGITLLVILGLIVLLLLLVLLVPARYRVRGSFDGNFQCKGSVSWLLHLVSIRFEAGKEPVTSIRILGIPLSVFLKLKKKKAPEDSIDSSLDTAPKSVSNENAEKKKIPAKLSENTERAEERKTNNEKTSVFPPKANCRVSVFNKITAVISGVIRKGMDAIRGIIDKIKNIIQKIKDFKQNIIETKKNLKRYIKILQSDTTKAAFALCKKKLFKILKHIFPRKLHADITFGFDDPAVTGYTLAVYGMLPAFAGRHIILHPDFDKQIFKADFRAKGAIRAWTLLFHVLGGFFDKNCQSLYHIVKKEIANEHK